jgi:hypothetical protein
VAKAIASMKLVLFCSWHNLLLKSNNNFVSILEFVLYVVLYLSTRLIVLLQTILFLALIT